MYSWWENISIKDFINGQELQVLENMLYFYDQQTCVKSQEINVKFSFLWAIHSMAQLFHTITTAKEPLKIPKTIHTQMGISESWFKFNYVRFD